MSQKIDPTARRIIIWAILLVLSLALFGISVLAQTHLSNNAATLSADQVNLLETVVLWCGLPGIFSATILIIVALNADDNPVFGESRAPLITKHRCLPMLRGSSSMACRKLTKRVLKPAKTLKNQAT